MRTQFDRLVIRIANLILSPGGAPQHRIPPQAGQSRHPLPDSSSTYAKMRALLKAGEVDRGIRITLIQKPTGEAS